MTNIQLAPQKPAHIPDNLLVGYQFRDDTLDGKLAFVTAEGPTGKIYSENNFEFWCSSSIKKNNFKNEPMHGFYLNKRRQRQSSYGSDALRVFHPLGFEFEIGMANIAYILQYANINMSEIAQKCVLGWIGGKLVLIPENSPLFIISYSLKDPTLQKVKSKVTVGAQYITSNANKCIYLGEHEHYFKYSEEMTKEAQNYFLKQYGEKLEKIFKHSLYSKNYIINIPIKQHLCYDVNAQNFIYLPKSSLKFECPDPVATQEEVNNLLSDFKNSAYGSPTVLKTVKNSKQIFEILKNAHINSFKDNPEEYRLFFLGKLNKVENYGIFLHSNYYDDRIKSAANIQNYYEDLGSKNPLTSIPSMLRHYNEDKINFISYLTWFKMFQLGYVKDTGSENFNYSAIELILQEFNKFKLVKHKKSEIVDFLDYYCADSNNDSYKKVELFDLNDVELFLNDCANLMKDKVKNHNDFFIEENRVIMLEETIKFFDQQEEKIKKNIDKYLETLVLENTNGTYHHIIDGDLL